MLAILLAGLAPQLVQAQSPPLALQLVSLTNLDNPGWQYRVVATGPSWTNAWLQVSHDCVRWTSETFVTLSGQLEGEAGIAATEPTTYYRLLLDDTFTANEMLRGMRRSAGARPQTMDATYASADPSRNAVGSGITSIDAAAVTGGTPIDLSAKAGSIDGSNDKTNWQPLVRDYPLFDRPQTDRRVPIFLPPGRWHWLRVTIDDRRAKAIPILGVTVFGREDDAAPPESQPLRLVAIDDVQKLFLFAA